MYNNILNNLINGYEDGGETDPPMSHRDSVAHQVNKILQYEQLQGGPGGRPLPSYSDPKYKSMLMDDIFPEVDKIMPNASAMEKGEAMDYVFNAGWDKSNKKIKRDPRSYALQEYYRKYSPSNLDKDGKWAGRKGAPYTFDAEYDRTIGKLPENERRVLMNKGRDWYYQNINTKPDGSPSDNYKDTWYGRIWNTNDFSEFNPNNPKFRNGGETDPPVNSVFPSEYFPRQMYKESTFRPEAVSPRGAEGLTQFLPGTFAELIRKGKIRKGASIKNADDAVAAQRVYMNELYNRPWNTKENPIEAVRLAKALAAYNMGPTSLLKNLNKQKAREVDIYRSMDWIENLPKETKDYVNYITGAGFPSDDDYLKYEDGYKRLLELPKHKYIKDIYADDIKELPIANPYIRPWYEGRPMLGNFRSKKEDGGDIDKDPIYSSVGTHEINDLNIEYIRSRKRYLPKNLSQITDSESLWKAREGYYKDAYNSPLTDDERVLYDIWYPMAVDSALVNPMDHGVYDIPGFWQSGQWKNKDGRGHGTDTYKKPNHITFSNESKWSAQQGGSPFEGGTWDREGSFIPGKNNFYSNEEINFEFDREREYWKGKGIKNAVPEHLYGTFPMLNTKEEVMLDNTEVDNTLVPDKFFNIEE